ncbi:hypothetical protein Bca4012_072336 [Brassica carinata]|uniref:Uncharacterized protein n=1 Tax=Brassica carinata TaxID=52824 RepID=A0A8X7QH40_BRACI|nr:hypothetical protein Bca52824_064740 [Brassica carinata]
MLLIHGGGVVSQVWEARNIKRGGDLPVVDMFLLDSKFEFCLRALDNLSKRELLTEQGDAITFESEVRIMQTLIVKNKYRRWTGLTLDRPKWKHFFTMNSKKTYYGNNNNDVDMHGSVLVLTKVDMMILIMRRYQL